MALLSIRRRTRRQRLQSTYITVCAWCGRVRDGERWHSAATPPDSAEVTHGICPECLQRQIAQIGKRDR
jgi:hypothetical protein